MHLQLPADIDTTLKSFLAGGQYASEVEILREALTVLKHRDENKDVIAIQEGFKDEADGRLMSARTVLDCAKQHYNRDSE